MKKHIHFIGIGGTAMASLAVAFRQAGFKITGSEPAEIFPPMSDYLKKNKIKYYFPFNAKKIGQPAEIVVGNAHYSDKNPEVKYAREHGIKLMHFPQLVKKYLIKKNSVIAAGTYAKTTTTSMLAWLLEKVGKNPNYLVGGVPLSFQHGARLNPPKGGRKNSWSVVEGDEYPAASPWDFSPKFKFYQPKYLVLTSAEWDHMDIYKTRQSYIDVFKKLVASMPDDGLIVAKLGGENLEEVLKEAKCKVVYYSKHKTQLTRNKKMVLYFIDDFKVSNGKTAFSLYKNNKQIGQFETALLGDFNLENWTGALALASELKLPLKKMQLAVKSFKGVKRRLEVRAVKNGIKVIDDFAHNPPKAQQSVAALKKHFGQGRIFVIFEPNRGGRSVKNLKNYNNIFKGIYKVFIPKFSKYKKKKGVKEVDGQGLVDHLRQTHKNIFYQPRSEQLVKSILKQAKSNDVIAFLGHRNFSGMIKEMIKKL